MGPGAACLRLSAMQPELRLLSEIAIGGLEFAIHPEAWPDGSGALLARCLRGQSTLTKEGAR